MILDLVKRFMRAWRPCAACWELVHCDDEIDSRCGRCWYFTTFGVRVEKALP